MIFSILAMVSTVIVVGGVGLPKDRIVCLAPDNLKLRSKQLPKLPNNHTSAYIAIHNQAILLIGASNSENHDGRGKKCY